MCNYGIYHKPFSFFVVVLIKTHILLLVLFKLVSFYFIFKKIKKMEAKDDLIKNKYNIFRTSNPIMFISDHIDLIKSQIDLKAEILITYRLNEGKRDQISIDAVNSFREKLLEYLNTFEKKCITKCTKNFTDCNEQIKTAFNRLKLDINDDSLLFQLQQELLLNTSIFFVKIFKVKFPNYFGSLVVINFYLSDHIISIIK
jgi:hypothetical protein